MRTILTAEEMSFCDQSTMENMGVSSLQLMERAGTKITECILSEYHPKKVLILCGSGGNGGDGYVIARILRDNQVLVEIYPVFSPKKRETIQNALLVQDLIISKIGESYDMVIDAILGVGGKPKLEESMVSILDLVNSMDTIRISVDIPTGVPSNTGLCEKGFIADKVYTVEFEKIGLYYNDGKDYSKEVETIPIGIQNTIENPIQLVEKEDLKSLFPKRRSRSNKGNYGRISLIAGSKSLLGASYIAYGACSGLLLGAGYSTLCIPESLYPYYVLKCPEVTFKLLPDVDGSFLYNEDVLNEIMKDSSVIGIGPGIGISENIYKMVSYLLSHFEGTLVIDADAINSLAKYGVDTLMNHKGKVILTPHVKEFSRLTGIDTAILVESPFSYVKEFAEKYHAVINLKSNCSVISDGKKTYLSITGNPSLARAGSGDLLTGITCAFCTRGEDPAVNAAMASFLLGSTVDEMVKKQNEYTILPTHILEELPTVITNYLKEK